MRELPRDALEAQALPEGAQTVRDAVTAVAAEVRENVFLRRAFRRAAPRPAELDAHLAEVDRVCGRPSCMQPRFSGV